MRTYILFIIILLLSQSGVFAQVPLTRLGSIAVPSYAVELVMSGTTAYVFTASAGTQGLRVYDVSAPAAPRLLSTLNLPTTNGVPPRHAAVSNNTLYVSTFPSFNTFPNSVYLLAIDVSNPAAPTLRQTVSANSFGGDELFLTAKGPYVYTAFQRNQSLNISDSNLNAVGTVALPYSLSGVIGLSSNGNTAYVQYANPAFATLDLTMPATPVSSTGTTPGTISAASGNLACGLQQPAYLNSVPTNTLRFYDVRTPRDPVLARSLPGTFGTRVAAGEQSVFVVGATSPFLTPAATSNEPLRGYYLPTGAAAIAVEAVDISTQGANALAVVGNTAYVLTDTNLSIYTFPNTVTSVGRPATRAGLSIHPNPAHNQISLPHLAVGSPVVIYDAAGRACLQARLPASGSLDLSALPVGLYQVRAGTATSKLLVE